MPLVPVEGDPFATPPPKATSGKFVPVEGDPFAAETIDRGPLSTSEAAQRGALAGLLGIPGDIESAARGFIGGAAQLAGAPTWAVSAMEKPYLPTTSKLEEILPGKSLAVSHPVAQTVGEIIPAVVPIGAATAEKAATEIPRVASDVWFGGAKRAQEAVRGIEAPQTPSVGGDQLRASLVNRFKSLLSRRQVQTDAARASFLAKNENAPAVVSDYGNYLKELYQDEKGSLNDEERSVLLDSARNIYGDKNDENVLRRWFSKKSPPFPQGRSLEAIDKEIRRLNDIAYRGERQGYGAVKRSFAEQLAKKLSSVTGERVPEYAAYRSQYAQLSRPINEFQDTMLGGKLIERTSDFLPSDFSVDTATLPSKFFHTRDSVNLLKRLAGGDTDFVEANARLYAASQLDKLTREPVLGISRLFPGSKATKIADIAAKWDRDNADWLNEVPGTKAAVKDYVKYLRRTSLTQLAASYGGSAIALSYLMSEGDTPWYWMRHLMPFY